MVKNKDITNTPLFKKAKAALLLKYAGKKLRREMKVRRMLDIYKNM